MELLEFNDARIIKLIEQMRGQLCCRQRITLARYISIGFGKKVFHGKTNLVDTYYGQYEVGSYNAIWRVHNGNQILLAYDDFDSITELDNQFQSISFGAFKNLEFKKPFDISIELENGIYVDFIAKSEKYDDIFHIYYNDNQYIEFNLHDGWQTGRTDMPD